MKRAWILLLSLIMMFSLGCKDIKVYQETEVQTLKVYYPGGGPGLSIAKLAVEKPIIDKNIDIDYEFVSSPDLLVSKLLNGDADIAIVPSNLAAQAYNKDMGYKLIGTSVWGTLHLISSDHIDSFDDLKAREIYSFGKDMTPDLVFKYILTENEIDVDKDISTVYLGAASEVGPAFLGGKTNLGVFSEPVSTNILMKNPEAKIVLDFNKEWIDMIGSTNGYPQASLIIKSDLIENHGDFVDKFIKVYEESQVWAKANPEELGQYAEDMEIGMKKEMIVNGIERMNIGPLAIDEGKFAYETYYNMLLDMAPEVIGGRLPDEGFYFQR